MARLTSTLILLFATLTLHAQMITGRILDDSSQAAAFAVVKLISTTDSSLVKATITSESGWYAFTELKPGTYYLQASTVGMKSTSGPLITISHGQNWESEPLMLLPLEQTFEAVIVKARKPAVEQFVDKAVLNISSDQTAQSKTAYELLQQAPGVMIDPNDQIRMGGKQGVNVFIDGKPTHLSPADLANFLRGTPAANIDNIELISNPSSRFDAQGGAGIINIRLRRNKNAGLNGNISGGYGQSAHHRANLALDLTYRSKSLNVYGNVSASDNDQITKVLLDRNANNLQFLQRGYDTDATRALVYKTGIDYTLDPKQTISLNVSGNTAYNRFGTHTNTRLVNKEGNQDSSIVNHVFNPNHHNRIYVLVNYRYADTLGLELNVGADLTRFSNASPSLIASEYFNADRMPLFTRQVRFEANTGIRIGTIQADLVKEWKSRHLKLETGFKHTDVATDNALLAFNGAEMQPDVNRTNRFTYREIVSAAYASLNHMAGKWAMQAGLRAERTISRGRSLDLLGSMISRPDTAYLNLFPTGFVQYQASENVQLGMTYGRRIGRPNYQDLNPFIYQVDPYTSQRGNPFLQPAYTDNAALSYTYKWATNVKLSYGHIEGFSTDVFRQQELTAYQTVANAGTVNALSLSASSPFQVAKWWNIYVYAGATWNRFRGRFSEAETFNQKAFALEGYMQHSFTISKSWSAQVSGFGNAPTTQTVYRIGKLAALNLSLEKKVLKNKGKLSFHIDDLFNTMRWRQSADFGYQQFSINRKWESRRATLRFAYRFGRSDSEAARGRRADAEGSRIKTKDNL